jgi:hypothetical protein
VRAVILAAAMILSSPLLYSTAAAQQVERGSIIRFGVTTDSSLRLGSLDRLNADSLVLEHCFDCRPLAYQRTAVTGIEVYRGSTRPRKALIGFLGGMLLGGGLTYLIVSSQSCNDDLCGVRYLAVPFDALVGGLAGMLSGIALGKEIWEPLQ